MINKHEFPILEFDTAKVAKLNPDMITGHKFDATRMIITFFPEVLNKLISSGQVEPYFEIGGENPFTIYRFVDD